MTSHDDRQATAADRTATAQALEAARSDGEISQTEFQQRTRTALEATTIAELNDLIDDIQNPPRLIGADPEPALPVTHQQPTGTNLSQGLPPDVAKLVFRIATIAAVGLLVLIGIATFSDDDSDTDEATAGPTTGDGSGDIAPLTLPGPIDMLTAESLDEMVEQMTSELDDTTVTSIYLTHDYASFDLVRAGEPGSYSYYYDGFLGVPSRDETGTSSGFELDLASLDLAKLARLAASLPERVGVPIPTNVYITSVTGAGSDQPVLAFYASSDSGTGYFRTNLDLELVGEVYRAGG